MQVRLPRDKTCNYILSANILALPALGILTPGGLVPVRHGGGYHAPRMSAIRRTIEFESLLKPQQRATVRRARIDQALLR